MRCSSTCTRADRLCASSPGSTRSRAWITAGPASSSAVTKWTVAPCPLVACLEGAPMSMQARILGQQCGVNVEDSPFVAGHELGRENAHEPGEHDQRRRVRLDRGGELLVVAGTRVSICRRRRAARAPRDRARSQARRRPAGRRARRPPRSPSPDRRCAPRARAYWCLGPRSGRRSARAGFTR